ncbi:hypothetical protein SAMN05192533_102267 [Mesobacillus persicus]|uniref:Phage tail tape measure protein, TP901 family, core region n=1 Tax=Mesobacillus persicus TaxID=930146 RepID=A0A1H7XM58_9BACI|nr:hypothetical protein [Mesobacillus persicus]SEM34714.1 hypothetical protein SAMN05192533_102267 [Mesobacillus persicus]
MNNGAYNLDKVNDLVKEMSISFTDGRFEEHMADFSKETQNTFKEFQKGEKTAKEVMMSIIKDLEGAENQQEKLTKASEIWSALGEDNAMKVIESLNDVNDAYDDVTNVAEEAKKAMEESFGQRQQRVLRGFKTALMPIGDELLSAAERYMPKIERALHSLSNEIDKIDWDTVIRDGIKFATDVLAPLGKAISNVAKFLLSLDGDTIKWTATIVILGATLSPIIGVVGSLTSAFGGLLKMGGSLSKSLGAGTGLLGIFTKMGPTGVIGLAVAGISALAIGISGLKKDSEKLKEVNLAQHEQFQTQYEDTSKLIGQFDELRNKTKLSNDQFAQYVDLQTRLQKESDPEVIQSIQQQMQQLQEKSGLTNEELSQMVQLNKDVTEALPKSTEKVTEQGNKIAGTTEELKKYNHELLEMSTLELEKQFYNAWSNQEKLLKEANNLFKERMDLSIQQESIDRVLTKKTEEQKKAHRKLLDQKMQDLAITMSNRDLSNEQREQIADTIELYGWEKGLLKLKTDELLKQSSETHQQSIDLQEQINNNQIKQKQFDQITRQLQIHYLTSQGISKEVAIQAVEEGNQLQVLEQKISALREQKRQLEAQTPANRRNTDEYKRMVQHIDNQIGGLETSKGKIIDLTQFAGDYNDELGKDIDKQVNAKTKEDKKYHELDNTTGKQINVRTLPDRTYNNLGTRIKKVVDIVAQGAKSIFGFADGTSYAPGGMAFLGEEGFEIAKFGNKLKLVDFGLYDMPRGTQVFTHEESKKMLAQMANNLGSSTGGSTVVQQTTNFSPNIVINSNNPFETATHMERTLRKMSYQGGIPRR